MPKQLELFLKEELTFREKFYKLMDILISNQQNNKYEALFFMGLYYLQILSAFYSEQIQVFDPKNCKSDAFLNYIEKIIRIKDIFRNNHRGLVNLVYSLFAFNIAFIFYFYFTVYNIKIKSIYSNNKMLLNYLIKIFLFLAYNINLDICFTNYCFGYTKNNPNFDEIVECGGSNNIIIGLISSLFIILVFVFHIYFQTYYADLFFFLSSNYAKMSCNYDYYMDINCLLNSLFLTQSFFLSKEIFLIFNLIYSIIMFFYYLKFYLFYDANINLLAGIFHSLYAWTSIFSILFSFINFREKGIIYIISSIIICFCYYNIKNKVEKEIFYNKNPMKIKSIHHLLFFFKNFTDKIISFDKSSENKALISGVIEVILEECPQSKILEKINDEIYLPINNKWRDLKKSHIEDDVFKKFFIIRLLNYFIFNRENCPDIYFNLSYYYLIVIQNYCQSMYFFQKIAQIKLSHREIFTYMRLKYKIQNALIQNLSSSDEQNVTLENVDISMYYKYDSISQHFLEEITNDIELSLEFWKTFRKYAKVQNFKINFNKVFKLTDQIQTSKKTIEKMWEELLNIYNGVNEYFEFYNDYIEQINDDDLKKRDLDSLKKKNGYSNEHLNSNYYSLIFNKDTGIIIADGDIGSEGIIKHCNKKIESIFNYNVSDLKELNVTKLMPKLFEKVHSKYIERYFRTGAKKYIETSDFKTFAKDKDNNIIQVKLGLKLLPILNYNVFFVGLIIKENIDDIILIDKDFYIQGMSSKLMKLLNIENNNLFQENNIPFYAICKKFVNFYNIFLRNKSNNNINELDTKTTAVIFEEKNNLKFDIKEENIKKNDEIHENIEINENVELEYEIKIPQFLNDYSKKTKNKINKNLFIMEEEKVENNNESEDIDSDEEELLGQAKEIKSEASLKKNNNNTDKKLLANPTFGRHSTPTPASNNTFGETPIDTPTPGVPTLGENLKYKILNEQNRLDQNSKEEKIYLERISQYETLFNDEKFNELEELIDFYNKDSSSSEYKFNFTFDNNKYGNNDILYIVRCIDNKGKDGQSEEKSIGEIDPKAIKYKKEKVEAIKPLFELLEFERDELLKLPDIFLKLSLENKEFQQLLEDAKNEIMTISKTHGQKKEEILEDENSSQTSQAGFDNGLVKKNRIEEIKANLFNSVANFFTLKYIKLSIILIMLFTIAFSFIYLFFILNFNDSLESVSVVNLNLFKTTLWTTELVSIFISLKTLLLMKLGKINIEFQNYQTDSIITNEDYYNEMQNMATKLYYNLTYNYGKLEMEIPKYLTELELIDLYWDHINVSYVSDEYERNGLIHNESFPTAMDQFLCNCLMFLKYNYSDAYLNQKKDDSFFEELFNYLSHLIIENAYNNIIPNQFIKLKILPDVFSKYNIRQKNIMIIIIAMFAGFLIIFCLLYLFMIRATNKSMTDGFKKITKIKLEKIEERIKKIEIFNYNLKKFRDRDSNSDDSKIQSDLMDDQISQKKVYLTNKSLNSSDNPTIDKNGKNITEERSSLSSIIGNNGFNYDVKRYLSLTILREYYLHAVLIVLILCAFIISIYYISYDMIQDVNQILFIEKFIYGKIISTSAIIIEVKCFISGCKNETKLDYSELKSFAEIRNMIKGLKEFKEIDDYYNNKYLLDACDASLDRTVDEQKYKLCLNESIIASTNNTDNLMKLIDNIIDNIYKKDEMDLYKNSLLSNDSEIAANRLNLFNESNFRNVELIFYKYIFPISYFFGEAIKDNVDSYLLNKKKIIIILVFGLALMIIIYCIIFMSFYIPRLIHFLSVSRSVMKIIPTSIIMITPELENWIENKN